MCRRRFDASWSSPATTGTSTSSDRREHRTSLSGFCRRGGSVSSCDLDPAVLDLPAQASVLVLQVEQHPDAGEVDAGGHEVGDTAQPQEVVGAVAPCAAA